MKEVMKVKCPNCGEQIPVDEKAYHTIVNEVCNEEVNRRVRKVKEELDEAYSEKAESIKAQAETEYQKKLETTRRHFVELREKTGAEIASLQVKIDMAENEKELAVSETVQRKDAEINRLVFDSCLRRFKKGW